MSILIVSGPIGAGKSTASKELEKLIPGSVALIEGDVFWKFIIKFGDDQPHEDEQFNKFKHIMTSMLAAALPLAKAKYTVRVDFSIPPWFVPTALKMAQAKDYTLHYVMLLANKDLCIHRAATRPEGKIIYNQQQHDFYAFFDNARSVLPTIAVDESTTPIAIATSIYTLFGEGKLVVK